MGSIHGLQITFLTVDDLGSLGGVGGLEFIGAGSFVIMLDCILVGCLGAAHAFPMP